MKKERKYPFCKAEKNDSAPVTEDVYAGPEFFSGRQGPPAGAFAPPPQEVYSKYCPTCGTPAYKKAKFCTECGYVFLKEDSKLCPYCGASNLKTSKFCSECGSRFADAENV